MVGDVVIVVVGFEVVGGSFSTTFVVPLVGVVKVGGPARRRRLVIRDSSSSSEEEFRLPSSPVRVRAVRVGVRVAVRQYADYVGGRVRVPASYFNLENDQFYGGRVGEWGRYRSFGGGYSYGYYIHYDDGIKYYMLESDVHSYIV